MRTNFEWLEDLRAEGERQAGALEDLHSILLRGSLYTFHRNLADFQKLGDNDVLKLAEDCAQDALLAVLAHLEDFRGDSKFTTWVYKFAVNISLTTARRERWKGASIDDLLADESLPEDLKPFLTQQEDPAIGAMQNEIWKTIREIILNDLTPRQRQVVKLMVFEEIPMDVVVERLGTNRNAIYKLLHDARSKLKQEMEVRGFGILETLNLFETQR